MRSILAGIAIVRRPDRRTYHDSAPRHWLRRIRHQHASGIVLGPDDITDTAILSNGDTSASEDTGELIDTSVTGPIASAPVYANTSGRLYEVEPSTGEAITIGDFRDDSGKVDGFVDIAIDLSGRMFGGTFESIYRIDPETAEVERLCDTEVELYAMTFTSDGRLIAGGPGQSDRHRCR